jgi:hypothetical protein
MLKAFEAFGSKGRKDLFPVGKAVGYCGESPKGGSDEDQTRKKRSEEVNGSV